MALEGSVTVPVKGCAEGLLIGNGGDSGDWAGIKGRKRIVQAPMIGPGLLTSAGDVEDETENLPADVFYRRATCGDAAGVDVDEIVPALRQCRT